MLHKVHWPTGGTVCDLIDGIEKFIRKMLISSHVYILFDRYKEDSIKSRTRSARIGSFTRSYHLTLTKDLPPKEICLTSIKTKEILIEIIAEELCKQFIKIKTLSRLVITSGIHVSQGVKLRVRVSRMDLTSFYEEAGHMIPQQI